MTCPHCQASAPLDADLCPSCGQDLSLLPAGSVLADRYEIVRPLGKGGMGVVYKAHDRELDDVVALKLLRPEIAASAEMARRFRSEIKLARKVRHKNVCGIHEYGQSGPSRFIAMEFIEGVDFRQILGQRPLPAAEAFDVACQIAEGLQAIHDAGVVHRDLKTPNIMRDTRGLVRLMDFGLAKNLEGRDVSAITGTGMMVGTPEYMSPEQVRGEPVDARSDLYALGIVIYELFTGHVPFRDDSPLATVLKHLNDPPPLQGEGARRLPRALLPVLERSLAKQPDDRYGSAREMHEALDAARRATPAAAADWRELATLAGPAATPPRAPDLRRTPVAEPTATIAAPSRPAVDPRRREARVTPRRVETRRRPTVRLPAVGRRGTAWMVALGSIVLAALAYVLLPSFGFPRPASQAPASVIARATTEPASLPTSAPSQPAPSPTAPPATPEAARRPRESPTRSPRPTPAGSARPTPAGAERPVLAPGRSAAAPSAQPSIAPSAGAARETAPDPAAIEAQRKLQQLASQVTALVSQAEAAFGEQKLDMAIDLYDQALKLDPVNQRAGVGKANALGARAVAQSAGRPAAPTRSFVAGETVARSTETRDQAAAAPRGFAPTTAVNVKTLSQAAGLPGKVLFDVAPPSPTVGQDYKVSVSLLNEGTAPIEIREIVVTTTVNGRRSTGALPPRVKAVAPKQKAVLLELSDLWRMDVKTFSMEVRVETSLGESYRNHITWQ